MPFLQRRRQQALLHLDRLRQGNAELFGAGLDAAVLRGWMRQACAASGGDCSLRVTMFARGFDHRHPARDLLTGEAFTLVTFGLEPIAEPGARLAGRF